MKQERVHVRNGKQEELADLPRGPDAGASQRAEAREESPRQTGPPDLLASPTRRAQTPLWAVYAGAAIASAALAALLHWTDAGTAPGTLAAGGYGYAWGMLVVAGITYMDSRERGPRIPQRGPATKQVRCANLKREEILCTRDAEHTHGVWDCCGSPDCCPICEWCGTRACLAMGGPWRCGARRDQEQGRGVP